MLYWEWKVFFRKKNKVDDVSLKEWVQNSLFLTDTLKQELLQYFERLSPKQKRLIYEAVMAEKPLLLRFLRQLRNKPELKAAQIQEHYARYKNSLKKQREYKEEWEKQKELESLFLQLEKSY